MRALLALVLPMVACQAPAASNATADAPAVASASAATATGGKHFGAPFARATAEPLSQAIARVPEDAEVPLDGAKAGAASAGKDAESCGSITKDAEGSLVRVSGVVAAVCQKAGCWMTLQDGAAEARIFMRDHGFTVPKDIVGKRAEVEGSLRSKTLSAGFAKHLAEDGGKDPSAVAGPQREYTVNATGVRIVD